MRPELLTPRGSTVSNGVDTETMVDMLRLVGENVTPWRIRTWSPLEQAVVYDWAWREHLHASDALVYRRQRPALLGGKP